MTARESTTSPMILCVDDDPAVLASLQKVLRSDGFRTAGAESPGEALQLLEGLVPDLILLDVRMPEMDGYELCERILARPETSDVPILFITVVEDDSDRARQAGGLMVLQKPVERDALLETVRGILRTGGEDEGLDAPPPVGDSWTEWILPETFERFRGYLQARLAPGPGQQELIAGAEPKGLYDLAEALGLRPREMAEHVAQFLGVPYVASIDPEHVDLRLLTGPFCRANFILPVRKEGGLSVVVSNPFDWTLLDTVQRVVRGGGGPRLFVSEPENVRLFFTRRELKQEMSDDVEHDRTPLVGGTMDVGAEEGSGGAIETLSNQILRHAIAEGASDLHLEPKHEHMVVRLRIDGDLLDVRELSPREGGMLIARYKALGRLDIAEKRKPQDGAMEAVVAGQRRKLRLATTATPHGESLVVRILDPGTTPPSLEELGMLPDQARVLKDMVGQSHGLVLVVGPTGSGKSTTIFALLSTMRDGRRSVITVEDPVEYEMPFANQQQVNERAGATFEALLRSAVRQDPDVLLIGEIRDPFSAKAALDFSSSGHLTVSTIHSSNATTAIFRLERLAVERGAMADAMLGILAQKLVKVLCSTCRRVRPIRAEERGWLAPFTHEVPERVAEPVGCPSCRGTGYRGREAVCEILVVDPPVAALIREGASIASIRRFVAERGDLLMAKHAVEKVRELALTPDDAYRLVIVEESVVGGEESATEGATTEGTTEAAAVAAPRILVAEDDADARLLVERHLVNAGYDVTLAEDGVDALMKLGQERFDLILSDINMPNLNGLKLLEMLSQRDVEVPVVFLTAQTDEAHEVRGFELGAEDYLHKPIRKGVLLLRIAKALGHRPGWTPVDDSGETESPPS